MGYHTKTNKWIILVFYFIIILISSAVGDYVAKLDGFGYGMTGAMVISIALWWIVGRTMTE